MIEPCGVEVGEVVGPAGSGVAGNFTGSLPVRSSPHSSSSEDITLTYIYPTSETRTSMINTVENVGPKLLYLMFQWEAWR